MRRRLGTSIEQAIDVLGRVELDLRNLQGQGTTSNLHYLRFESSAETVLGGVFYRRDVEDFFHTSRFFEIIRQGNGSEVMNRLVTGEIEARLDEVSSQLVDVKARRDRLSNADRVIVIPDSNVFVHYQPFDGLNWTEFIGTSVRLIVPLVVVEELDRLKRSQVKKIRESSRVALRKFEEFSLATGSVHDIDTKVSVEILEDEKFHIRASTPDDEVLEVALEVGANNIRTVIVVTGDLNMMVKARVLGISVKKVPSEWELQV